MRIKELRLQSEMSQKKLADKIGVSRSTLAMWETNKSQPDLETICKIADLFDTTADYVLGRTEAPPSLDKQLEGIDFVFSAETKDLSEEEKQDVLDYIQYKKAQKEKRKNNVYLAAFGGAAHAPEENKTPEAAREIFQEIRNEEN